MADDNLSLKIKMQALQDRQSNTSQVTVHLDSNLCVPEREETLIPLGELAKVLTRNKTLANRYLLLASGWLQTTMVVCCERRQFRYVTFIKFEPSALTTLREWSYEE